MIQLTATQHLTMRYKTSLLSQNEPYFSIKSVVIVSTSLLTAGNQKMIVDKSAKLALSFYH